MAKHDLTGTDTRILRSITPGGFASRFELSSTNRLTPSEVFESLARLKEHGLVADTEKDGPFVKLTEEGAWVRRMLLSHQSYLWGKLSAESTDDDQLRITVGEDGEIWMRPIQMSLIAKKNIRSLESLTSSELDAALDAEIGKLKLRRTG